MESDRLTAALKTFAEAERGIVDFGRVGDSGRALELVRMRKQMVIEFAALGAALEEDGYLERHPDVKTDVLRLFAAFRTANAINTAEWPAIRVRDDVTQFQAAAQNVARASQAFWARIRSAFPVGIA
jgi:hypothetical protein